MRPVLATACLLVVMTVGRSSGVGFTTYHAVRYLMGTWCDLTLFDIPAAEAPGAAEAAFQEIARLERVMSTWDPDSELSRINRNAGAELQATSYDLAAVAAKALDTCRDSGGAFDPTVGPMVHLWAFDSEQPRRPSPSAVTEARTHVGCDKISVAMDPSGIRLPYGVSLDLGGIGKGYAVDRALAVLRAQGIRRAKVDFGSSSLAFEGTIAGGWPVVVADPRQRDRPLVAFRVDGGSISSSGQHERSFVQDGRRYGHIFDPRTGEPVQSRLLLVSVAARNATSADALSTALFVMGVEKGTAFVARLPGVSAIFVVAGPNNRVALRTAGHINQLVQLRP